MWTGPVRRRTDGRVQGQHVHVGRKILGQLAAQMALGNLLQGVRREAVEGVLYTARIIGGQAILEIIAPPLEPAGFAIAAADPLKFRPELIQIAEVIWTPAVWTFRPDFGDTLNYWEELRNAVATAFEDLSGATTLGPGTPMVLNQFSVLGSGAGAFVKFVSSVNVAIIYDYVGGESTEGLGVAVSLYEKNVDRYAPRLSLEELAAIGQPGSTGYREINLGPWRVRDLADGVTSLRNQNFFPDVAERWYWQDDAPDNLNDDTPALQPASVRGLLAEAGRGFHGGGYETPSGIAEPRNTLEQSYGANLDVLLEEQRIESAWYMTGDWDFLSEDSDPSLPASAIETLLNAEDDRARVFDYNGADGEDAVIPVAAEAAASLAERMKSRLVEPIFVPETAIPYALDIDPALEQ